MELKVWVKKAREHAGWTIEQLATEMSRSKAAAGFWEAGSTSPSYAQVKRISEITGWPMPDASTFEVSSELQRARNKRWPFARIDQRKFVSLQGANARNLEAAILAAAADLNLDIRPTGAGKAKRA